MISYIAEEMKRAEAERDKYLRRCVFLEDENSKLKKLLELHGIEYPKERTCQNV